ncbi:hypothetical protein MLD38_014489 [Melastoma candidum]|uniref:Uncharacterized protein n=1 Tax=Melastoma candidum TaxID=119954 RepID=A0ACB9REU3_9MYRT|nr:hypothetical protein MLD38_014489 [Melastoma candidum]
MQTSVAPLLFQPEFGNKVCVLRPPWLLRRRPPSPLGRQEWICCCRWDQPLEFKEADNQPQSVYSESDNHDWHVAMTNLTRSLRSCRAEYSRSD